MNKFYRYLVVRVEVEVDMNRTDQLLENHVEEIAETLSSELHYDVSFDGKIEVGASCDDAIEVPVKIVNTEVLAFYDHVPL